jgi:hypothetical protein
MLIDTMLIESESNTHEVILVLDTDIFQGVEEQDKAISMSVYPNPATENVTVRCRIPDAGYQIPDAGYRMIELFSISGDVLQSLMVNSQSGITETTLDVSALPAGIYFIRLQAGAEYSVQKLIVR